MLVKEKETMKEFKKRKGVRGAEAVVLSLLNEGVDTIFGYPGGAIMPVYDALYDFKNELNHILTRHEQGAIHAAQGYARVSRKCGVVLATSGPGATNLITGIADAQIDSTPLVCITGQVASHLLGTDAFQETDVMGISMPVTKWNFQVTKAEEIAPAIAKAFFIAQSGRPGPVLIDITKDAQFSTIDFEYEKCNKLRSYVPVPKTDTESILQAAELINNAKKPYLLVGQGVLLGNAGKELLQLVEKAGIPVASTLLGLSAFPASHPLYVGYLGMHGNYGPNIKTNECDVLIAVGMRFDDRVTGDVKRYAKQAKVIHFEIDPAEVNKIIRADVAVLGDAKETLRELLKHLNNNSHNEWLNEFKEADKIEYEKVIKKDIFHKGDQLRMAEVVHMLSEKTNGQAVVVTDVGQHQMVTSRYYKFQTPHNNITSGGLGTMGFGLPAGLGAKLGAPHKEVIVVVGDGGFQMTCQELGTIMQTGAAVKILILNNNFLGMVRQWQQLFFEKRYSFTEMNNPDFQKLAQAYGIATHKEEERASLSDAIDKMLNHNGPYLLEVVVEKEDNVFPMVATGASVSEVILE
jgi:acetolactate synthase-1/2/3 large subunit